MATGILLHGRRAGWNLTRSSTSLAYSAVTEGRGAEHLDLDDAGAGIDQRGYVGATQTRRTGDFLDRAMAQRNT